MSRNQKTRMENKVEETKVETKIDANADDYGPDWEPSDDEFDEFEEEIDDEEIDKKPKKKWLTKANLKKAGKAVLYGAALVAVYSLGKAVEKNRCGDYYEDDYDAIEADPEPECIEMHVDVEPAENENHVKQETDSETEIGEHSENE